MSSTSLFRTGRHGREWVKDFYDHAAIWWGADPQDDGVHPARVATVARLCGPGPKRMLELGAGPGATAAAMADAGHAVVAVDLAPLRCDYGRALEQVPHVGALTVVEGDFYALDLGGGYDVVCCWETFGIGSDADQRKLLRRMAAEWLSPGGSALVDVFSPFRPIRDAGTEQRLAPLPGVSRSVEMIERCHFDPIHSRWIDEWVPAVDPESALAQSIRCYSPADLRLLVEGTGLTVARLEIDGEELEAGADRITTSGPLLEAWSYLALLRTERIT